MATTPVDTVAVRCAGQGALSNVLWEQDRCNHGPNGTGQKNGLRIAPGRPVLLTVDAFVVNYSNAQCSGVGTPTADPLAGAYTVATSRQEFGSKISAQWAARLTSPTMPMVFARKGYYLCLLDDSATPSAYPNAASTANAVTAAIAAGTCYTPR